MFYRGPKIGQLFDFGFFEFDVLARDRIVLLEFQLFRRGTRVLPGHVVVTGIGGAHEITSANALDSLRTGRHDTLVYHYDLLRPFDRPLHSHGRDPAFHLLSSANRITLITLTNSGAILRKRLQAPDARPNGTKARKRHDVILGQYENPSFLAAWYDAWHDAAARYMGREADSSHLVVTDEDYTAVASRQDLKRIY